MKVSHALPLKQKINYDHRKMRSTSLQFTKEINVSIRQLFKVLSLGANVRLQPSPPLIRFTFVTFAV